MSNPTGTDLVDRLRQLADDHYEMLGNIHEPLEEAAAEIERLRAGLQTIVDGIPSVRVESWRSDGKPSKQDKCPHGLYMYEECGSCISDYAEKVMAGGLDLTQQGEG